MRRWELFAFDLDGIPVAWDHSLPQEVASWVRRLAERTWVTLATGRSLASAQPFAGRLGINAPAILYHGAVIWDFSAGKAVLERRLPPQEAVAVLKACRDFPVAVQLYRIPDDPTVYVSEFSGPVFEFARKESPPLQEADLERLAREGPLKFLIIGVPTVLPELDIVLREVAPELTVVRAERNYLEVLPPGVDKGEALAWLAGYLRIPLEEVLAVGDQESDIPMIRRAGLGVAMAAAPEVVRQAADMVVSSVAELADVLC